MTIRETQKPYEKVQHNMRNIYVMKENEMFEQLMDLFIQRLRPVFYEIVNDCLAQVPPPMLVPEPNDLWTIKEVMDYFGCAKTTVFAWRKKGLLKAQKVGNKTFFRRKDVEKLVR